MLCGLDDLLATGVFSMVLQVDQKAGELLSLRDQKKPSPQSTR
jgi:hypothetical protein